MSDRQRTDILQAFDTRLWAGFNKETGTQQKLFRGHRVGPLKISKVRPSYTVSDNGQRRGSPEDNESEGRTLSIRLTLHLAEDWTREAAHAEWSNYVDEITTWLLGRPAGYGVLDILYVEDAPLDFVLRGGDREAVWVIDFEVGYFTEVDELDDWS